MADTLLTHNQGKVRVNDAAISVLGASFKVKLIKADFTQAAALVYTDLTFADFSGYADWAPTNGATSITSGVGISDGGTHDFVHDGGGTANTIYGAALVTEEAGPVNNLIATIKFDTPAAMASNGDTLHGAETLRALTE